MSQTKRQYEFLYPLSKTPFADVYRCHERHQGRVVRDVAIKILRENWNDNKESVLLLRTEISLLQSLHHASIPRVYEVTAIRGRIAIVMEWMEGLDLKSLVQGMRKMKQRIPLKVTLSLVSDIAETLDVIYNQSPSPGKAPVRVLHGNLKPSNITLDLHGKVSLLDFGLNRADLGGRESSTREMQFDSMEYMAPERLFFEPQASASDIYSLSITMFEMLAGKPLGKAPPSEEKHQVRVERYCQHLLRPMPLGIEVKEELSNLMISGLSYDANQRPNAHEFSLRSRRLSTTVEGVQSNQWAQKAIGYFQTRMNKRNLQGTLQGSVLAEDTEVFQRPISHDEPDVDTSVMRRGAVADFVEASLDLKPEGLVELLEEEKEPTDSLSFESSDFLPEPELQVGISVVEVPKPPSMPQMMSSYTQDDFEGNTMTADAELTQTSTTSTAFDIRPQAMAVPTDSPDGISTKNLVLLFLGGAFMLLLGIYTVVTVFGDSQIEPSPKPIQIAAPIPQDVEEISGVIFVSEVQDTKKISVR